jgi:hypothetical protein
MPFSIFAKNFFHKICQFRENLSGVEKYKVGQAIFFASPQITNPQILGSFRNRKSANFLGDSVLKSQILKFARKTAVFLIQIVCL